MIDVIENSSLLQKAVRDYCKGHPLKRASSRVYYDFTTQTALDPIASVAVERLDLDPKVFSKIDKAGRLVNGCIIDLAIFSIIAKDKVYKHDLDWLKGFQRYADQGKHLLICCMYADSVMRYGIDV